MTAKILLPVFAAALSAAAPAMAGPDVVTVRNISHVELSAGVPIVDERGMPIGTVKKVAGNTIVLTDGTTDYDVPVTELYAYTQDGADRFASRLPKSALRQAG
ncbi:hypothetical protein [Novosphingobium beihaiensis]|uniref:PRC-barrel domain-containing protein n=1 Tax=Novosphingobium beihaiensis TaxID=2930389 RepID=A0ABT0BSN6_9SPHN|nr:hypothetical protein [Novosphingobium beihaiensis]MCJ2188083.1 hypothetical protein [Novosphingobium beihaiensis]